MALDDQKAVERRGHAQDDRRAVHRLRLDRHQVGRLRRFDPALRGLALAVPVSFPVRAQGYLPRFTQVAPDMGALPAAN